MEAGQEDIQNDLRALLLKLYLKNNPQIEHKIFIYSYHGVVDVQTNPFHFIGGDLSRDVKKSLVLQNLPSGEMMQAFISSVKIDKQESFQIENTVLYGNKAGVITEISLKGEKIAKTEKYRQFLQLAKSLLRQFKD
ncbi:Uncharacterised protein [Kingella denitrificans]|uniref:Uncharacterized protein n=1 Tax=Kingella denitrificans ATCC 33394 TaxID=888741 RepID=F0EWE1_9NEIS|nr:hypothetical protein [Kingella denitrificans]EGC18369.1 hypothetical protein HMPREF9098_0175 [Kingella denitrificans ATCC 33394]STR11043.1 Uncharacterised protein [Kingella denitrificans]